VRLSTLAQHKTAPNTHCGSGSNRYKESVMTTCETNRRKFLLAAGAISVGQLGFGRASAQANFPTSTIELVVHVRAGGGADLTVHSLIAGGRSELGWQMALGRKPGGGGVASHAYLMERPRDGHTVLLVTSAHIATIARGASPVKVDDLVFIAQATVSPMLLLVRGDSPIKSIEDYIAEAKKRPLNVGIVSVGGGDHITGYLMAERLGLIQPKVVPHGSSGEIVINTVGRNLDAGIVEYNIAETQLRGGDVRAIASFTEKRLAELPNVPTAKESGAELIRPTLRGFIVLKGTPEDRVDILRKGFLKAMNAAPYQEYLKNSGIPVDSVASGEVFEKSFRALHDDDAAALKALGIK
jgi:tripartite-type tricarboxylate transporter receptor subunit TctC